MESSERRISFDSGGLALEGALHEGAGDLALLMLHPHPKYGGDMDSHVVMRICRALADLGATTLRFNFRGAGRSEGTFDGAGGEAADARVAASALRRVAPGRKLMLAGYSFGALVAADVAEDVAPDVLVLVSPPFKSPAMVQLPDGVPALILGGDADEWVPAEGLRALEGAARVRIVSGAGHSWWPGIEELSAAMVSFVGELTVV